MSTETTVQTVEETKQVLVDEDDNQLVTREDLEEREVDKVETVKSSLWSDPDRLAKLRQEMQILAKVRIPVEPLPEEVILKAMAEVLAELGWSDYRSFNSTIKRILTGPPKSIPFAVKTRNQRTGKMDFWLIRVFINIGESNKEYEFDGKKYNKRDVLMSHQFCDYLRDYCRTELHDEAQFWTFTGSYRNKQHLDMSKLNADDMAALKNGLGETNANNLIMIQFKRKTAEVYVGAKKTEQRE